MKREFQLKTASATDQAVLRDLTNKASTDVMRVLNTTTELAMEIAGVSGMTMISMAVAHGMLAGIAMAAQTEKTGECPKKPDAHEMLLAALVAAVTAANLADVYGKPSVELVREWYKKLTGVDAEMPASWGKAPS